MHMTWNGGMLSDGKPFFGKEKIPVSTQPTGKRTHEDKTETGKGALGVLTCFPQLRMNLMTLCRPTATAASPNQIHPES